MHIRYSYHVHVVISESHLPLVLFIRVLFTMRLITIKIEFSIKDLLGKCDQIRSFLRIWAHLLKKSLIKNFIFYAVYVRSTFTLAALH